MPIITRALLRKRSEHNEGMIASLEEITLHQEELESINEVLGMSCRKLKILYLQNNIIPRMENLFHLKDLEYLNMALNNVQKIEGLQNCEFLRKLDLTINFVDLDELKSSMDHLSDRKNLVDLYMMGNPCQASWDKFNNYVIGKLPQLTTLDGTEITRSMQIQARQMLPKLEKELEILASKVRLEKALKKDSEPIPVVKAPVSQVVELEDGVEDVEEEEKEEENEMTENTPEARIKIYQELAQQKREKEERANVNTPKQRDYEKEQVQTVTQIREKEAAGLGQNEDSEMKQRNEGGWDFFWDEESRPGFVVLDVHVAKHLDSSLIDVDVHPMFVSIIIKSKVLRLRLPAEVRVSDSKCQRSKISGSLMVIMPKVNAKENAVTLRGDARARGAVSKTTAPTSTSSGDRNSRLNDHTLSAAVTSQRAKAAANTTVRPKKLSLQEEMLLEARASVESGTGEEKTTPSVSLLDSAIGSASRNSVRAESSAGINSANLRNIVKQPRTAHSDDQSTSQQSSDLFELETVFTSSNRVTELD